MDHLNALYKLFAASGMFTAGVTAGLVMPIVTAAGLRWWSDRTRPLTRAAAIVAALPTLVFTVLLFLAPPAASGWDFVVGFFLFGLFSLPTWLVLLTVVWLMLVMKRRLSGHSMHALPAEVRLSTVHAGGGAS